MYRYNWVSERITNKRKILKRSGEGEKGRCLPRSKEEEGAYIFLMKQVPVIVHFFNCPFDFLLRLFNNKKNILTKVTMTVLLVMTNNSVLMQHNIMLVQLPFYNITPNISVCNNYISPYFFATCFQYNFANRVNLSSACVQI